MLPNILFYGIPLVLVLIAIGWFISVSNMLNRYQVSITESKANVDIELAKRYDTISAMLASAKSYAKFEKETLTGLVKLRQGATIEQTNSAIKAQADVLGRLLAVAEQYPQLQSSAQFQQLQAKIDEENEQLAGAKRVVNSNISVFNQKVVSFPISVVAEMKRLTQQTFLIEENIEQKREINNLDFGIE